MAKNRLSDDEIVAICQAEIDTSSGYASGELSDERATAMDFYLGEPYGDEVEGRSAIVTRETMETIEWILPSLVRIFADTDNMVTFDPVGPEDVKQAKIETETVNHVYWKQNRGFYNTYTAIKDCLLSKTGILKIWWDDKADEEREEYQNLDDMQLGELWMEKGIERELLEHEETEDGHHVVFHTTHSKGRINIEPVPPEEFGISRDARSPYIEDSNFCYHRSRKSFSDLVEMGYDPKLIRSLPANDDVETEERIARRHLTDENETLDWSHNESMRKYWITECYLNVDRDGDDIAEILKVTIAAGSYTAAGARLLDIEEVDRYPFVSMAPVLLTHKFYGLSIADLTMDLQHIKSTLTRQTLDNTYLATNGRTAVNDRHVNLDDLLTSRPGGIVRYQGDNPAGHYITPIPHNQLPQETFQMLEYLDEVRKQRTGVGDDVGGLDTKSLSNINTGVAALAYDASRMKIELIARIIAEVGFRPLFKQIHELLSKHQDKEMMLQIAGEFAQVNPGDWRKRINTTVSVGVGTVSRERKIVALEAIMQKQMEQMQMGGAGVLLTPEHLHQSLVDWTDAYGLESGAYWQDPSKAQPQQPKPDLQGEALMIQAKAMMTDAESKVEKNKIEMMKNQAEAQSKMREQQLTLREQSLKGEIEKMKAELALIKNSTDSETKVASLELQMEKQDTEQQINKLEVALGAVQDERDREIALYKIQMDSLVRLMQQYGMSVDPEMLEGRRAEITEQSEAEKVAPEQIREIRDWMGELIAQNQVLAENIESIKTRPVKRRRQLVKRDANGLILSVEDDMSDG